MISNKRSSKSSAILAIAATAAVLITVAHWSAADDQFGSSACSGTCSIYAPDAETVIRTVPVTGSDLYSLKEACAQAAGYFDHPWSVAPNPECPTN